jgi:hypothetical protein
MSEERGFIPYPKLGRPVNGNLLVKKVKPPREVMVRGTLCSMDAPEFGCRLPWIGEVIDIAKDVATPHAKVGDLIQVPAGHMTEFWFPKDDETFMLIHNDHIMSVYEKEALPDGWNN